MVTLQQLNVALFLQEFKEIIGKGKIRIVRRKGKDFTSLGLTYKACIDELLDLTVEHYSSGPEPDRNMPGMVWKFGKMIGCTEAYIKVKIAGSGGEKMAVCISCHPPEHELKYPFAK